MTDALAIGIRFALYADLILLTGLAAFPLHAFARAERQDLRVTGALNAPQRRLALLGLIVSLVGVAQLTASMQGVALLTVDPAMLMTIMGETDAGTASLVRMAALGVAFAAATRFDKGPTTAAATIVIAGSTALATLMWAGHAGASEGMGGAIHRVSDALHMIAAAVWIGAIGAFLILLRPRDGIAAESPALVVRSLDRFARVGTLCVLVIAATGLINTRMIVGSNDIVGAIAAPYGQLLAVKLLFFALMLALAAANRWRLTPALADDGVTLGAAQRAIRRSLTAEIFAAAAVLALVAWLGTLEPVPA